MTATADSSRHLELSIVMPCLNEIETVAICVRKARGFLASAGVSGEVIVADNGSTDGSREAAAVAGAHVVDVRESGYGAALTGGVAIARGEYVIMGDSDDSYDFAALMPFLSRLRSGDDLVMGNRFLGGIERGAMPVLHRLVGNPFLTLLGKLFFRSPCRDIYCGLRGFRRTAVLGLDLRTTGMEFALEMVVKATLQGLRIAEVPIVLHVDGRSTRPKLRTWRDGWRSLRFLLLYSPRWLFFYPGIILMVLGLAVSAWLLPAARTIGGVTFDVHTLLYAAGGVILGFQSVALAVFTKVFASSEGLLPRDPRVGKFVRAANLEAGLIVGSVLVLLGIAGSVRAVRAWGAASFGGLDPFMMLRIVVPSVTACILGGEIILASFFLSVLGLRRR
jgi:glycosyltransferase involved in cell wall biosynthesis